MTSELLFKMASGASMFQSKTLILLKTALTGTISDFSNGCFQATKVKFHLNATVQ